MKDIKTKEARRAPKLKDPVSRMPKNLMREAVLRTKQKSRDIYEIETSRDKKESPAEYSHRKIESAGQQSASMTARAFTTASQSIAKKSCKKIGEGIRGKSAAEDVQDQAEDQIKGSIRENVPAGKPGGFEKAEPLGAETIQIDFEKIETIKTSHEVSKESQSLRDNSKFVNTTVFTPFSLFNINGILGICPVL